MQFNERPNRMAALSTKANRRIAVLAVIIFAFDQLTKWLVLRSLNVWDERVVIPGFFNFVHRQNTGAAWSMFTNNNGTLAIVAIIALVALFFVRHHFNAHTLLGQFAFGLIFGGIIGNLIDRLLPSRHAVVDFLYFYLPRRGGGELGFPAFNIADSAICTGVALIFIITWKHENSPKPSTESSS
jgi:signal peptidase II